MKLTKEQLNTIDTYIDERHIEKVRLMEYLEKHATIKNDIFKYCSVGRGKRHSIVGDDIDLDTCSAFLVNAEFVSDILSQRKHNVPHLCRIL